MTSVIEAAGPPGAVGAGDRGTDEGAAPDELRGRPQRRTRLLLGWALVALIVIGTALVIGGGTRDRGAALDPRSTAPDGTRALVQLLERFGARVDLLSGAPRPGDTDVALVLQDRFGAAGNAARRARAAALEQWARAGGRLVVADPSSPFSPRADADDGPTGPGDSRLEPGDCDVAALAAVGELLVPQPSWYRVPAAAQRCFSSGADAFVVVQPYGQGTLVSVGSPQVFVNERLDEADNAVLAVALLAPAPGTRVAIIEGSAAGSGDKTLSDLIPLHVQLALAQLAIAFVLYALWRARRLGRPVEEASPVQIDAAELVVSVGRLLEHSHDPGAVAQRLRADTRRVLADRLGLPHDAPVPAIAAAITTRRTTASLGANSRERIEVALGDAPITDDRALVALVRELDLIRLEACR